ncbi:TPA: ATP-binding cassette domain-containing protein, partial [Streptococcus suis]
FISRKYELLPAIVDVNLSISKGEFVGLLGANGAGKTTLIKLMIGILPSSEGSVMCDGFVPYNKDKEFLKRIGVVLGQKSQLLWDLPALETFELLKVVYELPSEQFEKRLGYLCDLMGVSHKLKIPVRKLSLGERMKFEIICSLIHSPKILFLDEPTIGLDINSQIAIRNFLLQINQREGVTILLTSHYTKDIETMCQRVIVLVDGVLTDDLSVDRLLKKYGGESKIAIKFSEGIPERYRLYQNRGDSIFLSSAEFSEIASELDISLVESIVPMELSFEEIISSLFTSTGVVE